MTRSPTLCRSPSHVVRAAGSMLLLLAFASTSACGGEPAPGDGHASSAATAEDESSGYLAGAAGARLHYRVLGSGSDTVVVLHGGPGAGMNSVLPDFAPLAERFTLVFYDQRGGGRSTLPADTSLLHARYFVEDLEAVRRHFGLERLQLVTHSFGAIVAARYAREHPDRIERMVLHGATGPLRSQAARIAKSSPPPADTALANRASVLLRALLVGTAEDPVATCREYEAIGRRLAAARGDSATWKGSTCDMPPEAVRYYYRHTAQHGPSTFGAWDFTTGLEEMEAPVLVVYGARDTLAVPAQRAWADAVPNGRLLLVEEAAKGAIDERPDVVVPAVVDFLRGE